MEKLTASNLKTVLWETLNKVKDGSMDPGAADSIATQSREILRTTAIQLKIANQSKREVPVELLTFSEGK